MAINTVFDLLLLTFASPIAGFVILAFGSNEIWIHEGVIGVTSRGIDYWQSEDGKDRRLNYPLRAPIFSQRG